MDHEWMTSPEWDIETLGWRDFFADQLTDKDRQRGRPGRIIEAFRKRFLVHVGDEVIWALARGSMFHNASSAIDLPAVGDWAIIEDQENVEQARLWRLLDRRTALVRQAAGEQTRPQVIAANLDVIFVVTSLNQDFNARRLERYLALVDDSKARPVIVLNKADLCDDRTPYLEQVDAIAPDTETLIVSMVDETGIEDLRAHIAPGETAALIGSSGVGKSTIVNALVGDEVQQTAEVREGDDRGRHTTTSRQLVVLPDGGLVIDTPGMRELGLWTIDESALEAFEDIEALAAQCKFRDCRHDAEVGCAVKEAVAAGDLDAERLSSWRKLRAEIDLARTRREELARIEERRDAAASKRRHSGRRRRRKKKKK